jgi:hypothetical protein
MPLPGPKFTPTLITCPACAGVLSVQRESAHLQFCCSIGHGFSIHSLLQAKEEELEKCLWSAISLLEHVDMVGRLFVGEIEETGLPVPKEGLLERMHQNKEQMRQLRQIIEDTITPDLGQEYADPDETLPLQS